MIREHDKIVAETPLTVPHGNCCSANSWDEPEQAHTSMIALLIFRCMLAYKLPACLLGLTISTFEYFTKVDVYFSYCQNIASV